MTRISINISDIQDIAFHELAKTEGITFSEAIRRALHCHLKKAEASNRQDSKIQQFGFIEAILNLQNEDKILPAVCLDFIRQIVFPEKERE